MKLFNWLFKSKPAPAEPRTIIFFDGDQGLGQFERFYKELPNVDYHWVQNSRMMVPNKIKNSSIEWTIPSDVGKESVDTYIAMKAVHECASANPPSHIFIISRDMDFIDVIINAALLFAKVKFTLMVNQCSVKATAVKKHRGVALPANASLIFYRPLPKS